jgi:hypothetical protein
MAFDWKSTLAAVAPVLGTAFGGPLGGVAANAIAAALGVSSTDEQELAAAMQKATPDQLLALKTAENQFKLDMKKLDLRPEELEVEDRTSARSAYAATKDYMVPGLAALIVTAFVVVVGGVLFGHVAVDGALAGTLIGYLSAKAEQVLAFYFGSSKGSKNKDDSLAAAVNSLIAKK